MALIPYANIVCNVMYLMICTRPDVSHAISVASRYMADPGREHWNALKWILKYLKDSMNVGLKFGDGAWSEGSEILKAFVIQTMQRIWIIESLRVVMSSLYMAQQLVESQTYSLWLLYLQPRLSIYL